MSATWWTILVAGAGTFSMRAAFLVVAGRLAAVPPWAHRLLRQIPPAALASIVAPALLRPQGTIDIASPELAAGALAAVVAWRTRNAAITLVVGMAMLVVFRAF